LNLYHNKKDMKLLLLIDNVIDTSDALKALSIASLNGGEVKYNLEDKKAYSYQPNLKGGTGIEPTAQADGFGFWLELPEIPKELLKVELSNYSITDETDLSNIKDWAKYGPGLIGGFTGLKDWKCLRSIIKELVLTKTNNDIGTSWESLDTEEKLIACQYITNLVPSSNFASTVTDANERAKIGFTFDSLSTDSRKLRLSAARAYLLKKIGSTNAKIFLDDCIREGNRIFAYIEGIESFAEDGRRGLKDMVAGSGDYDDNAADAMKGLIYRGYPVTDGSNDTLTEVANTVIGIFNGLY